MTAPGRSGAEQATVRGLVVLFVAVVIGIALLSRTDQLIGSTSASSATTKTTTTTASTTTTPDTVVPPNTGDTAPTAEHTPGDVRVLVVNAAGGLTGVAKKNGDLLTAAGFKVVDLKNGTAIPNTTVYFAPGFQADADAVKAAVKVSSAQVVAAPKQPIVPGAASADVTVAFGQDYKG